MKKKVWLNLFIFFAFNTSAAQKMVLKDLKDIDLGASIKKALIAGEMVSNAVVSDFQEKTKGVKMQNLEFYSAGVHPKDCVFAFQKLSRYEDYKTFLSFIKESSYVPKTGQLRLLLSTAILPFNMVMRLKLPRILGPGDYPFQFNGGFLIGLTGVIKVIEIKKQCLLYVTAQWQGKASGFPNIMFELFSATLGKLAVEGLIRSSKNY